MTKKKMTAYQKNMLVGAIFTAIFCLFLINPAFAAPATYQKQISDILTSILGAVGIIFVAVGVVMTFSSAFQLIMAFRADNGEQQTRAAQQLAVGVIVIAAPIIIKGFNLIDYIVKYTA